MQNNSKVNLFTEQNNFHLDRNQRRTSLSGFEQPKDLPNFLYPINFPINGISEKKFDITNPNFLSENNVNFPNNKSQYNFDIPNYVDPRYTFPDNNGIPRFVSTPFIPQSVSSGPMNAIQVPISYNQSYPPQPSSLNNNPYNGSMNYSDMIYPNDNSLQYLPSFVVCDPNTLSQGHVLYYSPYVQTTNGDQDLYSNIDGSNCQNLVDLTPQFNREESCFKCQMDMNPETFETKPFQEFVANYMASELPTDRMEELDRAETKSLPSLHGDDNVELDLVMLQDDRLNTVHGDEMSQELKKISEIFKDVADMTISRSKEAFGGRGNISRFKKTRITERTTKWRVQRCLVSDSRVKVIPDKVANISQLEMEQLDRFEEDTFGCALADKVAPTLIGSEHRECLHSVCRCRTSSNEARYLKHSNRANQKYRNSYNSPSPNEMNTPFNKTTRRQSSQIPLRIVLSPYTPLLASAVPNRNRQFFDQSNNGTNRCTKRVRRWSLSGTKMDKYGSLSGVRPQTLRQPSDFNQSKRNELTDDNRFSFELENVNENSSEISSDIFSSFESKLDKHMVAIKKNILSFVDSNLSEIRQEIQLLRGTKTSIEKQVKYYEEKVLRLENSIRHNLPEQQWTLYGINDHNAR